MSSDWTPLAAFPHLVVVENPVGDCPTKGKEALAANSGEALLRVQATHDQFSRIAITYCFQCCSALVSGYST